MKVELLEFSKFTAFDMETNFEFSPGLVSGELDVSELEIRIDGAKIL